MRKALVDTSGRDARWDVITPEARKAAIRSS